MSGKKPLQEGYQPTTKDYDKRGYSPSTVPQGPIKPPPSTVAGSKPRQDQGGPEKPTASGRTDKDASSPA